MGVALHQALSFSPLFDRRRAPSPDGGTVFFPGCSMLARGPALAAAVFEYLTPVYPGIGVFGSCCGYPSTALGREKERLATLTDAMKGVRTVITCCPICSATLKKIPTLNTVSIWRVLDEHPVGARHGGAGANVGGKQVPHILHDPCPTRDDPDVQEAFRRVMARAGVSFTEYHSNRGTAMCCGKGGMLMALHPDKGMEMLRRRIAQSPKRDVLTYCFACADSFRSAGCRCVHGLELLFPARGAGAATRFPWLNRLRSALWI
jgi:Fe-S oxidoreductase